MWIDTPVIVNMDTKQRTDSLLEIFGNSNLSDSDFSKYNIYQCNNGICQIYNGHNVINVSESEIINLNNTSSSVIDNNNNEILNYIAILNCDNNACKRTYGYIKTKDGQYYSISYPGFNNTKLENNNNIDCDKNTDIGVLTNDGYFCQKINNMINNPMQVSDGNKYIYYIISAENDTKFHVRDMGKSLIISATPNTLIFDGLSTNKGLKLFDNGAMIKAEALQITNSGQNLSLYYCDDNSICHSLEGYVTNGESNYDYVEEDGSGSSPYTATSDECSFDSIGKLDNNNKFCLGNENVDFLTADDDTSYYIFKKGDNYSFVRGIKNIFAIEDHNYEGIINQIIK